MSLAILPAAGESRRMGQPKLLLPFGDTTVLGSLASALRHAAVDPIIVVVAPKDAALAEWCRENELRVVINPDPERGMLSSLGEGLDALGGGTAVARGGETLLVSPGDLPVLKGETVSQLLAELDNSTATMAVPTYGGRRGHPLALRPPRIAEIPSLDPQVGLRQLLELHPDELLRVPVDDAGILLDIDTPEDYRHLLTQSPPR